MDFSELFVTDEYRNRLLKEAHIVYSRQVEHILDDDAPLEFDVMRLLDGINNFMPDDEFAKMYRDVCKKHYTRFPELIYESLSFYYQSAMYDSSEEIKRILVIDVIPLHNMELIVFFNNGKVKKYDVKQLLENHPEFNALSDFELFRKVCVDPGGYGISWNDLLDCSENELYENGEPLVH